MIIPSNPAPIGLQGVGGAAKGVRGYLQAQEQENEQRRRDQLMERDAAEQQRRLHLYDLSSQELSFRIKKFQQEQDQKERQRAAGGDVNKALLDLYNAPPEGTPDPNAPEYGEPGFQFDFGEDHAKQDQADDGYFDSLVGKLRQAVDNGDVAPEVAAQAAQHAGTLMGARRRERGAKRVAAQLNDYIAKGFASMSGALGIEHPDSGDPEKDPITKQFYDLLKAVTSPNSDPAMIDTQMKFLVDNIDRERNQAVALAGEASKLEQEFAGQMATADPRQTADILSVKDQLARGDFGAGANAGKMARAKIGQIIAGTVPVQVGGKIVYVPPEDAAAVQAHANRQSSGNAMTPRKWAVAQALQADPTFLSRTPEKQQEAVDRILALTAEPQTASAAPAQGAGAQQPPAPQARPGANGQAPAPMKPGVFKPLGDLKRQDAETRIRDLYAKNDSKGLKALLGELGELAPSDQTWLRGLKAELDAESKARAGKEP